MGPARRARLWRVKDAQIATSWRPGSRIAGSEQHRAACAESTRQVANPGIVADVESAAAQERRNLRESESPQVPHPRIVDFIFETTQGRSRPLCGF